MKSSLLCCFYQFYAEGASFTTVVVQNQLLPQNQDTQKLKHQGTIFNPLILQTVVEEEKCAMLQRALYLPTVLMLYFPSVVIPVKDDLYLVLFYN